MSLNLQRPNEEVASLIEHSADDERLAKYILDLLLKHYPGHNWVVQVFGRDGYATIRNPSISYTHGMRIIFPKGVTGPKFTRAQDLDYKVIMYGGEFLERYDIRRKKADRDETEARWPMARFR